MTQRVAARIAGAVWVAGLAIAIAAAVLQYATRDVPVAYYGVRGFQGIFGLVIAGTGWLIASRRHRNPIGWIFIGAGFISCVQAFLSAYGTFSIARHDGALPLTPVVVWLGVWVWVLIVGPLSTYVLMLFPEGRLETARQRALAVFAALAIAAFAIVTSLTPGQAGELPAGVLNPYSLSNEAFDRLSPLMGVYALAVGLSIAVLVGRFRRSSGELRQQMKWITFAGVVAATSIILSAPLITAGVSVHSLAGRLSAVMVILGFGAIPVAAGVAILRYGLYEIDVVINKTIVYALLAVFITGVYLAVVVGVGAVVGAGANTGLSLAATAIVAVAVQPVRARAAHVANRLVFGKRATPYEALSEFSGRLSEQSEDAIPRLGRLVTEATAATSAGVWLAVGSELRPVASWPEEAALSPQARTSEEVSLPGWDRVYPVRHEGEVLGALAVTVPASEPLTAAQERLLSDLAAQAGLLLRNARLIEELRASRQRLVAAQDQERRRIERDLHDGAQQQLIALIVRLRLLGRLLEDAPPEAREMAEQLRAEASDALENLRALLHGIYPPLLAERGLVAALEGQAAKSALDVTVEGEGLERYPQQAESAVYFCVLEALQNVAKYAGAPRAHVTVRAADGGLAFEVRDEGAGFDLATGRRGLGLTNMADRVDALGGRLEIASSPGAGTTVSGWIPALPIRAGADAREPANA